MSRRRWLVVVLSFAVALGVSAYLVWSGWSKHGAPPLLPWWAHFAVLGLVGVEILARGLKLHWSAAAIRVELRLGAAIRVILGGDFAAAITPGRSGAEPARFLVLAEAGLPAASIILVLFIELFLELVSLAIIVVAMAIVFRGAGGVIGLMVGVIGAWVVLVGAAAVIGWYLSHRNTRGKPPEWARKLGFKAGAWRRVQHAMRALRASVASLRQARPLALIAATIASAVHVAMRLSVLVVIVQSVAPETATAPLLLWSLVIMYGSSIAPAPGGGGAVEFSFKLAFASLLAADVLAGSLIWWRVYTFYLYMLLGALAAGSTVLRALRERPEELLAEAPDAPEATPT
jgi:uncharacterized protein (TIRG00374 family)